jgi:hypothetical protein
MANNPTSGARGADSRTGSMGNFQNAADRAREATREGVEAVRDTATGVMDRARDVVGTVVDKSRDAASNVAETARDWAAGAVGAVKESDAVHKATDAVNEAWETGSKYIHDHNLKDMADDVAGVIRRNPIPALLVGIGLGFILGRSMRSYS